MKAIKKSKYIGRVAWINTNNHPCLAPFCSPDDGATLEILRPTYDAWAGTDAVDLLAAKFTTILPVDALSKKLTATNTYEETPPDWFWEVYHCLLARANAKRWGGCIKNSGVIPLTDEQCAELFAENDPQKAVASVEKPTTEWLARQLQQHMDNDENRPDGYFVKCGSCSTKHHYEPLAVRTGMEATMHLLEATPVLQALSQKTAHCIFICPFNRKISSANELRVFVREGQVTGVSQQHCYQFEYLMWQMQPDEMVAACQDCYDEFATRLPPRHRFSPECTFDAYFQTDSQTGEVTVHLIEINSSMFGWGPAGSSLFHWLEDPPPKTSEPPVFYIVDSF